jgi:hypothetical protein
MMKVKQEIMHQHIRNIQRNELFKKKRALEDKSPPSIDFTTEKALLHFLSFP